MTDSTDYDYSLLMEGKLDLMFLPSAVVAWLWQYDRPEEQTEAAIYAAATAHRAGNPVVDGNLLRADHNVLVLHLQSGNSINVYPVGGYGSNGQMIEQIDMYVQDTVYGDPNGTMQEPVIDLPDDLDVHGVI